MYAYSILNRFQQIAPSLPKTAPIQVVCDGERLFLQTGEHAAQRFRLLVRLGSGLGFLAGLTLAFFSIWGGIVSVVSLLAWHFAPRFIASRRLLEMDTAGGQLILLQNTGAEVRSLPLLNICGLHGVYETKGWDPYSVLYAQMQEGAHVPILLLMGGSEKMAAAACGLLGSLLDCPATYTGPFGETQHCYTPALAQEQGVK